MNLLHFWKKDEIRSESNSGWNIDAANFPEQGTTAEKLRFLLGYAILAPSNYNTQPWIFDLYEDRVHLVADRSRSLPIVDPLDRELVISCGAALAFLQVAAIGFGYGIAVQRFPDSANSDLLACVSFKRNFGVGGNKKALDAILKRRTNRNTFDSRAISSGQRDVLDITMECWGILTSWIDHPAERKKMAEMMLRADKNQSESSGFLRELTTWVRPAQTSARDGIPSGSIGTSGIATYIAPLLIRTLGTGADKVARDQELMRRSPGILVMSTAFDQAYDWLMCGEALGSTLLKAEQLGLKVSYLNQLCEVDDMRLQLSLFSSVKGCPQLILRFGSAPTVQPTPRRLVEEVIRDQR